MTETQQKVSTRTKVLKLLLERKNYISGQEICEQLQVSRTAVWKAITGLRNDGYMIEAVQNKGYCLLSESDALSQSGMESRIRNELCGNKIVYLEEADSTNLVIKKLAEQGEREGLLAVADRQTAGKGRRGRAWATASGEAIAMSLLLRPDFSPDKAPMLTLLMAVAVAQAVDKVTGQACKIKWPNDLVMDNKKITGILTEMSLESDYISYVVIGTGINVNQTTFSEELQNKATSLYQITGKHISRTELIGLCMEYFEPLYRAFQKKQSLAFIKERYCSRLTGINETVKILDPKEPFEGISRGINDMGELLVETPDGRVREIYAGEVSVRGLYSYV